MRVLALDTALGATSVGVFDAVEDRLLAQRSMPMERGHAETLMPMIEAVLAEVPGGFESLDRFAVTVGPGSFTGIRIGLAAARAFALVSGKPAIGVSVLSAFVAPFLSMEMPQPVAALVDARHGQVFFQFFSVDGRSMAGPNLYSLDDVAAIILGSGAILVGNGVDRLVESASYRESGAPFPRNQIEPKAAPDIAWVARLGAVADPESALARPLYLRETSAMPQDRARIAQL
jgi:tRNA threonylcarbamoyladenosine biosynthesis protein TsaB